MLLSLRVVIVVSFVVAAGNVAIVAVRDGLTKKTAVLLDFAQMRRGEGPAQFFCLNFKRCIFGQ